MSPAAVEDVPVPTQLAVPASSGRDCGACGTPPHTAPQGTPWGALGSEPACCLDADPPFQTSCGRRGPGAALHSPYLADLPEPPVSDMFHGTFHPESKQKLSWLPRCACGGGGGGGACRGRSPAWTQVALLCFPKAQLFLRSKSLGPRPCHSAGSAKGTGHTRACRGCVWGHRATRGPPMGV